MSSIWSQFVNPVGFSNGCAEFALKNPPPLLPSSLIDSWEAIGPSAMVCCAPSRVVHGLRPAQVWVTPCRDQHDGRHEGDRQQDVHVARVRSTQKLPMVGGRPAHQAARQGDGDGDADGGRGEVLDGQAGRLGQVGHRRLAGVVLPVRVGHEADGRVEAQELLDRTQSRPGLSGRRPGAAGGRTATTMRHDAEQDDRDRVRLPALLGGLVDAGHAIDGALDRPQDRRQDRAPALEHGGTCSDPGRA